MRASSLVGFSPALSCGTCFAHKLKESLVDLVSRAGVLRETAKV